MIVASFGTTKRINGKKNFKLSEVSWSVSFVKMEQLGSALKLCFCY